MVRKSEIVVMDCKKENTSNFKSAHGIKKIIKIPIKSVFIFHLLFLITLSGFSQSKFEKEYQIDRKQVPLIALSFVDSLIIESRVRWYKEEGLNSNSIEAKGIIRKEKYSIEFFDNGKFQDVEIEVKPSNIPGNTYSKILGILSEKHKWYKIDKIQQKFTGDRNAVLRYLREQRINPIGVTIEYEIIISTKTDKAFVLMEYTFSEKGDYIKYNKIIQTKNGNLDFGT